MGRFNKEWVNELLSNNPAYTLRANKLFDYRDLFWYPENISEEHSDNFKGNVDNLVLSSIRGQYNWTLGKSFYPLNTRNEVSKYKINIQGNEFNLKLYPSYIEDDQLDDWLYQTIKYTYSRNLFKTSFFKYCRYLAYTINQNVKRFNHFYQIDLFKDKFFVLTVLKLSQELTSFFVSKLSTAVNMNFEGKENEKIIIDIIEMGKPYYEKYTEYLFELFEEVCQLLEDISSLNKLNNKDSFANILGSNASFMEDSNSFFANDWTLNPNITIEQNRMFINQDFANNFDDNTNTFDYNSRNSMYKNNRENFEEFSRQNKNFYQGSEDNATDFRNSKDLKNEYYYWEDWWKEAYKNNSSNQNENNYNEGDYNNQELQNALKFFNLSGNTTYEEFKKRYRELARAFHPDSGRENSQELMTLLNKYRMLLDNHFKNH
ncbi:hypothetical protein SHELI_v1c06550 [Spiroplasma helicoides]|uniref:J domain-containing protein n=1 Tax=Spiroplasma helicoides TaxID=216938 RepID=A0A1B3SL04_9MOLU|nr:J domain-containing protein [Spiroplasma helicoides]AOG60606.1 hypothetical protein SHELI_v1c06550 [Spiroplasma helicoides]